MSTLVAFRIRPNELIRCGASTTITSKLFLGGLVGCGSFNCVDRRILHV